MAVTVSPLWVLPAPPQVPVLVGPPLSHVCWSKMMAIGSPDGRMDSFRVTGNVSAWPPMLRLRNSVGPKRLPLAASVSADEAPALLATVEDTDLSRLA